ncbi:MAG: choice-of-anchor E domain-containing protein [Proteobacteria bacterium]|nr:choice-of-anchor E domain-containing protein [Pseudomonadota bacterium]
MRTGIIKILAVAAMMIAGLFASLPAAAGLLTTPAQIQAFSFATPNNTTLSFNGFDSTLGTLNSVHFVWSLDQTLNNTVINTNAGPSSVGNPVPLTATATTTFTGTGVAVLLTGTNTLTTAGFTGSVPGGMAVTTVGTASVTGMTGGVCLSNDLSCGAGNTNLAAYIGGLNLFNIDISGIGNQGGTVPAGVFSGNNSNASGSLSITYDYTAPVSAPATSALLLIGLVGMIGLRRKS